MEFAHKASSSIKQSSKAISRLRHLQFILQLPKDTIEFSPIRTVNPASHIFTSLQHFPEIFLPKRKFISTLIHTENSTFNRGEISIEKRRDFYKKNFSCKWQHQNFALKNNFIKISLQKFCFCGNFSQAEFLLDGKLLSPI